jgi:hypothetical protein
MYLRDVCCEDGAGLEQPRTECSVIGNAESSDSATGDCEIGSNSLLPTAVVILDL